MILSPGLVPIGQRVAWFIEFRFSKKGDSKRVEGGIFIRGSSPENDELDKAVGFVSFFSHAKTVA